MGIFNWKYNATDIADWFDAQEEKQWRLHDEWLIDTYVRGDTQMSVFGLWAYDRFVTGSQRSISFVGLSVIDFLRLGNDFDFDSWWGIAKGTFLNLTRLATVVGPAGEMLGYGGRSAGMVATSQLKNIAGAEGPCTFVAVNNVLSYLRGKTIQLFAAVEDIIAVSGANGAMDRELLLASEQVRSALAKYGVTWERLGGVRTIEEVLRAAQASDGPIVFGIKWIKDGKEIAHAVTAVKDANGVVRLLDYVGKGEGVFKGFGSFAEMGAARPGWGSGFSKLTLNCDATVMRFSSQYLKLLRFADGTFSFGVPAAMGLQWMRGATREDRLFNIAQSAWRFFESRLEDNVPTPPTPKQLPPAAEQAPAIPATPDPGAKALGVAPLAKQAHQAPRIDWLTGVQYRLRYLGYYKGQVHGKNDESTKTAVLRFQKKWFSDPKEWDSIPGPITQSRLYSVVGW